MSMWLFGQGRAAYTWHSMRSLTMAVLTMIACTPSAPKAERTEQTTRPMTSATASSSSTMPVHSAPSLVAPTQKSVDGSVARVRAFVTAWSEALNAHNIDALDAMYAARVRIYGQELTREAVLKAKRAALGSQSTFRQSLVSAIRVEKVADGWVAKFAKQSGAAENQKTVNAMLKVQSMGSTLVIAHETDETTEANLAVRKKTPADSKCHKTALAVVETLPEVKAAIADAERGAKSVGGNYGGMGPIEHAEGFSGALGVHTKERFESYVNYDVDRGGTLTVTIRGEDITIPTMAFQTVMVECSE